MPYSLNQADLENVSGLSACLIDRVSVVPAPRRRPKISWFVAEVLMRSSRHSVTPSS